MASVNKFIWYLYVFIFKLDNIQSIIYMLRETNIIRFL